MGGLNLLIDPYLSNHLGEKYQGTRFPHRRMMPPPISASDVQDIDYVLCTHRHGDHMDPPLLRQLAASHAALRFVMPEAIFDHATETIGLDRERLIGMDAGCSLHLGAKLEIAAVPAAHEALETDASGRHHFLGYVLKSDEAVIYHSGDSIPFTGLAPAIRQHRPDIALLPVNGRSAELQEAGVPGNFYLREAIELCQAAGVPAMIAHHFGMFRFNTLPPEKIDAAAAELGKDLQLIRPRVEVCYRLVSECS
ncbi:beta-lactamase domain-containing protein [Salinisphaera hydrothermalis C27AD]